MHEFAHNPSLINLCPLLFCCRPVMQLPCGKKASVAVRFCPQLFKLRETKEPTKHLTNLPYRMVRHTTTHRLTTLPPSGLTAC